MNILKRRLVKDSACKLYLQFDGLVDQTAIQDLSASKHVITPHGAAKIVQTSPKFGSGCAYYADLNADYFEMPDSADWDLGNTFTYQQWFKGPTLGTQTDNMVHMPGTKDADFAGSQNNSWLLQIAHASATHNPGEWRFDFMGMTGGSYDVRLSTAPIALSSDTWYHLAWVRNGTDWYCFLNGTSRALTLVAGATNCTLYAGTGTFRPAFIITYTPAFYQDDVQLHNVALYTSDFTVPAKPYDIFSKDRAYTYPSNSVLKLHCDGTNGSTTFTDSSPYGHTVTANGTAQITTTSPKLGSGCLLLDGNSDYLVVGASSKLNLATSTNFTLECWVYLNAKDIYQSICQQQVLDVETNFTDLLIYSATNLVHFRTYTTPGSYIVNLIADTAFTTGVWYHIAVVRNGSVYTLYINGVSEDSTTTSSTIYGSDSVDWWIGTQHLTGGGSYVNGKIDELVISNYAKYLTNFVPNARGAF